MRKSHYDRRAGGCRLQNRTLSGNAVATAVPYGPASVRTLRLKEIDWQRIVPIAHKFSANVVASLYNYVDPDFEP